VLDRPRIAGTCTAADLAALFGEDIDPEWVLSFMAPELSARVWDRFRPGWWELVTIEDYEAGHPPPSENWILDAPLDIPADPLAGWTAERVGHPVALEKATGKVRTHPPFAHWHTITLYWVRRDT
jgi:hypothetical protein